MTEPSRENDPPTLRLRLVLFVVLLAIGALVALFLGNAFGVRDSVRAVLLATGEAEHDMQCQVVGRVVDVDGNPVAGARVRCKWEVSTEAGVFGHGNFTTHTDAGGSYAGSSRMSSPTLAEASHAKIKVTVQAFGAFCETQPSTIRVQEVGMRDTTKFDLQLGAKLPTVPVRCVDRQGEPVTVFWVKALPAEPRDQVGFEDLPFRHKDFPDGIAELAVPPMPFRVEVHVLRGLRKAVVGPFDPDNLPARIDVTLPDE